MAGVGCPPRQGLAPSRPVPLSGTVPLLPQPSPGVHMAFTPDALATPAHNTVRLMEGQRRWQKRLAQPQHQVEPLSPPCHRLTPL